MTPSDTDDTGTLKARGYTESFFGDSADSYFGKRGEGEAGGTKRRYYGKYRGTVVENADPLSQCRLIVTVPDVKMLSPSTWALPCVPFAGPLMGMYVVPPPIGAGIWVEFEQGDPDKPIWVGCYWDNQPVPGEPGLLAEVANFAPPGSPFVTIEVPGAGIGVTAVPVQSPTPGLPGSVTLYAGPGTSITLSEAGISLFSSTISITATEAISLVSPNVGISAITSFNVNGPALTVK
jgi:hypothetical protein